MKELKLHEYKPFEFSQLLLSHTSQLGLELV
jgi:hypothetical protein